MPGMKRNDPHAPMSHEHHHADRHAPQPQAPMHQHRHMPMHGCGQLVNFAFKQVSLFGNDKHVHVLMWLDGQPLNSIGHGMGEVSVQMLPGRHTVGLAVYNPDALFDNRHPRQPESTAAFELKEHAGLLGALFGGNHRERHVSVEFAVSQNVLTKTASAQIRRIKVLR